MRSLREPFQRWRRGITERPMVNRAYRLAVGVLGVAVLAVGIVTIPYPGPGWLIVFAGLGILASEFTWARRLLHFVRVRYDAFMAWFRERGLAVQAVGVAFTAAVVLATLWALGAVGLVGGWFGFDQQWLAGPFG